MEQTFIFKSLNVSEILRNRTVVEPLRVVEQIQDTFTRCII